MNKLKQFWVKTKSFFTETARVMRVTKKPNKENFKMIVKVSALGMIVIGFIGFLISFIGTLLGVK